MQDWLAGMARTEWWKLDHAYGAAGDVPRLLWRLTAPDLDERDQTGRDLVSALCHQGDLFSASAAAVPFLARLASSDGCGAYEAANLLAGFANAASACTHAAAAADVERAIRAAGPVPAVPDGVAAGYWSCGFGGQGARPGLDDEGARELVAALGPADATANFKSQVDAMLLAVELGDPEVGRYENALQALAGVSHSTLAVRREFTRLFSLAELGRVDDAWRRDARALAEAWIRDATGGVADDNRTSPCRHVNGDGIAWMCERLNDPALADAVAACTEPVLLELSPWGHWLVPGGGNASRLE